ncbi:hypothetical protein BABINDRAFT_42429 [Babjeviella inositovora NRRL Y-12698]|uniref:Major facilitator superfamily (MFS) profile domain-containing protein n=1 Tax=Babjeviella inositovora NRRL Y-12698 TaxID=984486 RepID=A0A1E3QHF0_9ASCO|nr:uncharacterized protein BABINDRAFT_42429 [Babjeviella inositovora NRRL Y-12698]ODQ77028.1 hypothetical protein BABINDRAFT_42429 [Babjeviella inositovora NRRL Y-12698]
MAAPVKVPSTVPSNNSLDVEGEKDTFSTLHNDDTRSNLSHSLFLGLRGTKLQNAVSLLAGIGFLLFGYDQGVMGSLLTLPAFRDTFKDIDVVKHPSNATLQGFVIAVYEIGCLAGALATMYFGDRFGRLKMIFYGCWIMLIGAILQTSAYGIAQLIVARVVSGVGNGFITSTVPMWQSECARPENRGKMVIMQCSLITLGITISYWIDFGFYFVKDSSAAWRFPIAFQLVFIVLILPLVMKLPESPRWLMKRGRVEDARRVFAALEGCDIHSEFVEAEILDVSNSLKEEEAEVVAQGGDASMSAFANMKIMFRQGKHKNFHRVMLGVWSQIMQQITGINLITYYAGTIFESYIGMSPLNSRILAACNGTEYFLFSWVAYFTIERFGRRKLMLFGCLGQTASMAILTGTTWAADIHNGNNSHAAIVAAVFLFVFNSFFAVGWLGMTWLYPAEIVPLSIRAPANGLSTAANWSFNFMVVMITPVAFETIGSYTYTIFAVMNFLMIPVVYFLYPETAGRSLEEMDKIFSELNPMTPWDVVGIAKKTPMEAEKGASV